MNPSCCGTLGCAEATPVLLVNAGSIPGAAQQVRLFSRVASIGGGRRRAPFIIP